MVNGERTKPRRRTAADAIVEADVRFRLQTAVSARYTGLGLAVYGAILLLRPKTWVIWRRVVRIELASIPEFAVSYAALAGLGLLVTGSAVMLISHRWLTRKIADVRNDPKTAAVLDRPAPPEWD